MDGGFLSGGAAANSKALPRKKTSSRTRVSPAEWVEIDRALEGENPNISEIFRKFGVSTRTLHARARKKGIHGKGREEKRPKMSEATRAAIVAALRRSPKPVFAAIARQNDVSRTIVGRIANEENIQSGSRKGKAVPFETGQKILQELSEPDANLIAIAKKYDYDPKTIARIKKNAPHDAETRGLSELSYAQRKAIITKLANPDAVIQKIADEEGVAASTVVKMAKELGVSQRDNSKTSNLNVDLFLDSAEELVRRHLGGLQPQEIKKIRFLSHQRGWLAQIEGIRAWPAAPASIKYLDSILTHYLVQNGISGPANLIEKAGNGYVHLKIPAGIFLALHFVMAARGVIFNRHKIRNQNKGCGLAPNRDYLETFALGLAEAKPAYRKNLSFRNSILMHMSAGSWTTRQEVYSCISKQCPTFDFDSFNTTFTKLLSDGLLELGEEKLGKRNLYRITGLGRIAIPVRPANEVRPPKEALVA